MFWKWKHHRCPFKSAAFVANILTYGNRFGGQRAIDSFKCLLRVGTCNDFSSHSSCIVLIKHVLPFESKKQWKTFWSVLFECKIWNFNVFFKSGLKALFLDLVDWNCPERRIYMNKRDVKREKITLAQWLGQRSRQGSSQCVLNFSRNKRGAVGCGQTRLKQIK